MCKSLLVAAGLAGLSPLQEGYAARPELRSAFALASIKHETAADDLDAPLQDARLDQLASNYNSLGLFQGAVLVAHKDRVLLRKGYGLACAEHGVANTPATRFRLASVTKALTATLALRLAEQGVVDLQKPISQYLPKLGTNSMGQITLHQLLSHSSGLTRNVESLSPKTMADQFSMDEMIELIAGSTPKTKPGTQFAYSNAGYVLCAAVIEAVTDQSYGVAMRQSLLEPLNMRNTRHEIIGPLLQDRAYGYIALPDGLANAQPENKSYVTGAGSLCSTVDDLWRWLDALQGGRILSDDNTQLMFDAHADKYGYGWFIGDGFGPFKDKNPMRGRVVHHDGGCPGFSTQVVVYLDARITVVVLSNARPSRCGELAAKLGDMVLGLSPEPPKPEAGREIYRMVLGANGLEAAETQWNKLRASGRPQDLPSPQQINFMGYRYLQANLTQEAIRIFELYTITHPKDANAYDSLGEAHMTAGDRQEAIRQYRKSLLLNPGNTNARSMLAKLEANP